MAFNELSRQSDISAYVYSTNTAADLKTPVMDMLNYESVLFIGAKSVTNASAYMYMRMSTASASAGMTHATGDQPLSRTTIFLDVQRPIKRYVQGVLKAATTTGSFAIIQAIKYNAKVQPTTHSNVSTTGSRLYSPGSGTATG